MKQNPFPASVYLLRPNLVFLDALKSKTTDDSIQLKKRYLRIGSTDPSPKSKFDLGKTDRANLKTGPSESKSDKTPTKDLKQQPKVQNSLKPATTGVVFGR